MNHPFNRLVDVDLARSELMRVLNVNQVEIICEKLQKGAVTFPLNILESLGPIFEAFEEELEDIRTLVVKLRKLEEKATNQMVASAKESIFVSPFIIFLKATGRFGETEVADFEQFTRFATQKLGDLEKAAELAREASGQLKALRPILAEELKDALSELKTTDTLDPVTFNDILRLLASDGVVSEKIVDIGCLPPDTRARLFRLAPSLAPKNQT